MNQEKDFYSKLVDLYAERALPEELESAMEAFALHDPELNHDMTTLRRTVDNLRKVAADDEFTEESCQRILAKMIARGAEVETRSPEPNYLQYHLPIMG